MNNHKEGFCYLSYAKKIKLDVLFISLLEHNWQNISANL